MAMVCGHIAEILQARFRTVFSVVFFSLFVLGFFLVILVTLDIFIIDLNSRLCYVLLSSADDIKLGDGALEHRSRTENDLGKLEKWFGK